MRLESIVLKMVVVCLCCSVVAQAEDPFSRVRDRCHLGDSLQTCRSAMPLRELKDDEAIQLLRSYPFNKTHCFLTSFLEAKRVVIWTDDKRRPDGWPIYVSATFSEDNKLTDLLGTQGGAISPLVEGLYSERVASLKAGMTVEQMYELVGQRDAEYTKGRDGKWLVRFIYSTYGGKFHVIEADAASGVVVKAFDGTI